MTSSPATSGRHTRTDALRDAAVLCGAGVVFWVLLSVPAWLAGGMVALSGLTISALLCLIPGCVALAVKTWLSISHPGLFLLSSGLRFLMAGIGALVANATRPDLGLSEFYIWLALFYLFVVGFESLLTLSRMGQLDWIRRSNSE